MLRQRLCTTRGRLLLLIACTLTTLACPTGEALATVPVNGPSGWQTGGFTVTVTDGYSYNNGATMSCSNNNGAYMTYYGAGPNSGGILMEQQWYVPNEGSTTFNCQVWNSTHTATDYGSGTFYMDNQTPWASINVGGGTMGANGWYTSFPSVWGSYGNVGPSGTASSGCSGSSAAGSDYWTCSITDNNGLGGSSGAWISYDPYTPNVSTAVSGGSQANGWYSSAPSITANTSNVGPSGIAGGYPSCTGLANGTNSVTCTVRDNNGLQSTDATTTIRLDTQTPSNTVPSSTGTWYTTLGSIPTLSVKAAEGTNYSGVTSLSCTNPNNGASGTYSLSQAVSAGSSLSGTYPTSDLAIGTNTITCASSTGAGKTASSSFTVLYDPQTPTAQISTTASSAAWYPSLASIPGLAVSGTVGTSGVKTFTCSGDGISLQSYANNTGGTISLTGLNQGAGTITCTLTANNGESATTTQTLHLDTTTPAVAFDTAEDSSSWYTTSDLPTVTIVGATSGGSGIDHLTCNGDGLPSGYTINAATGTLPAADLNQGTGQITCTSTSGAGLTSASESLTVNIDNTVPTAAINSSENPATWYQSASAVPAINVSSTAGPSGIAWVYCAAPGVGDFIDSGSGQVNISNLTDGADTVTCTPLSNAGLSGTPVTLALNVDSQTPTVTLTGPSQSKWYSSTTNIPTLNATAAAGASGLASIDCSGDGITNQSAAFNDAPVDLTGLNQGTGTITCTATSVAGLTSTPTTFTVNLDSSTPTATWATSESQTAWYPSASSVPAITVTGATTGGSGVDHITCGGDGISGNIQINGSTGTVGTSQLPDGTDSITCAAVSGAGLTGASITRTIQVDSSAPTLTLTGGSGTWNATSQNVLADATASTNPSGVQSIDCATDSGSVAVTNAQTAVTNVTGDGTHHVSCYAVSGAGLQSATKTATVKIDSQSPNVQLAVIPAPPTAPAGTIDVQVTASESNQLSGVASTSCSLDGQTATVASGATQTVQIIAAGLHTLACTATTGAGVTSPQTTGSYQVQADPTQMALAFGATASNWQSSTTAIPVSVTGAQASQYQSMTCDITGQNPVTLNGTSGTLTVNNNGVDRVSCYATGINGADSAAAQITVHVDNQQPQASWSQTATADGQNLTLTGSEATPLSGIASESCSVDSGQQQTSSTSHLTVAVNGNGSHTVNCQITTGAGVTAAFTKTEHIAVPALPPTAASGPNPDSWYTSAQNIVLAIPTSGPAITSVTCTLDGTSTNYPVTGSTVTIPVPAPGGTVNCVDNDANGDSSTPVSVQVNIDTATPTGYFIATGPTQATVHVTDSPGQSGIASVTIQYQTAGGAWTTIPGATAPSGSGDSTVNLPLALQQPGVTYSLRALATNNAGGQGTITTDQNGAPVTVTATTSPSLMLDTGLYVGAGKPGARVRVAKTITLTRHITKTAVINGRKITRHLTQRITKRKLVWQRTATTPARSLTVAYGQPASVAGQITDTEGPLPRQAVTVLSTTPGQPQITVGSVQTTATGTFHITLPRGANRVLTIEADGHSTQLALKVHGAGTLHARMIGQVVHATVKLSGVTHPVSYRLQQRRGGRWLNLGAAKRTTASGHAKVTVRAHGSGALRLVVAQQPGWDYLPLTATAVAR